MTAALPAFALAATVLIVAPGPDSMLVMRNTLRSGHRAGWVTAAGTVSGLFLWAVAAAFGLAALVRVSRIGYDALRVAGAVYLIWLGLSSLGLFRRSHSAPGGLPRPAAGGAGGLPRAVAGGAGWRWAGWRRVYLNGLMSNLCNPKIGVFFVAFLPAFIPAGVPVPLFSLALGLWFMAETSAWLAVLAWLVARGVAWLRRSAVQRWLERLTGIVLIGFGLRLATESR